MEIYFHLSQMLKNPDFFILRTVQEVSVFGVMLVRISPIWTEYGEKLRMSPYSVQMRENKDQNNFKYGHFLRSIGFI